MNPPGNRQTERESWLCLSHSDTRADTLSGNSGAYVHRTASWKAARCIAVFRLTPAPMMAG